MKARASTRANAPVMADDRSAHGRLDGFTHVGERDVARYAYDLYLARGREDGHDVEDWLHAERKLRQAAVNRE